MILFYAAFQQFGRLSAGDANLCSVYIYRSRSKPAFFERSRNRNLKTVTAPDPSKQKGIKKLEKYWY